jgi:hypothetical protein
MRRPVIARAFLFWKSHGSVACIGDKSAAGDDLAAVGADQLQRALDQFGGDAAAA